MSENKQNTGVILDPATMTYRTKDGTSVAAELVDNIQCLSDIFVIANIREEQRAVLAVKKIEEKPNEPSD